MTVHRKRARRATGAPRLARGTYRGTLAAGDDLEAAANLIADEARRLASWSRQVPDDITVEVDDTTATISSDVGPAYPNEVNNVWHPTFGHRPRVLNKHRPFLAPAMDAKAPDAAARYAQKVDRLAEKAGFKKE